MTLLAAWLAIVSDLRWEDFNSAVTRRVSRLDSG
jgi:hypothetical protein